MSVSLSPLLDAPEDILHEWCLPECFLLPGRQRCCAAAADLKEICGLLFFFLLFFSFFLYPFCYFINFLLKKTHLIHSSVLVSFTEFKLDLNVWEQL